MKALSFTARVYKVGINPCVDAPPETGKVFQRRGFIPIAGLVNGEAYRATLVPRGGGLHNPKSKEAFSQLVSVGAARRPYLRKTAATFRIAAACFFLRGLKVISSARRAFPVLPCACLRAPFSSHRISVAARA